MCVQLFLFDRGSMHQIITNYVGLVFGNQVWTCAWNRVMLQPLWFYELSRKFDEIQSPTHINLPCTKRLRFRFHSLECVIKLLGIQDKFWHRLRGVQCWTMTWSTYQLIMKCIVGMPKLAAVQAPLWHGTKKCQFIYLCKALMTFTKMCHGIFLHCIGVLYGAMH